LKLLQAPLLSEIWLDPTAIVTGYLLSFGPKMLDLAMSSRPLSPDPSKTNQTEVIGLGIYTPIVSVYGSPLPSRLGAILSRYSWQNTRNSNSSFSPCSFSLPAGFLLPTRPKPALIVIDSAACRAVHPPNNHASHVLQFSSSLRSLTSKSYRSRITNCRN